jgi:large subunit ribosomal protein L6
MNNVTGVTKGWTRTLELSGVGYRATVTGTDLTLNLGFSHPVIVNPPVGVAFTAAEGKIVVAGTDKQLVGQVAAKIRELKKPEPYKGKGIKYQGEHVRKKAGKAAKAVGGAPGAK